MPKEMTNLRTQRILKGFSVDYMAEKIGVSTAMYRSIELGTRTASDENVAIIEKILGVHREKLFQATRFQVKSNKKED